MRLFPIFGDQLSHHLASLCELDPASGDVVLMMEVMAEATYVPHHPRKIALIFSAMRHFASELEARGITVRYVPLNAPENGGSFFVEVQRAATELGADEIIVTWPGEFRVLRDIQAWEADLGLPVRLLEDDRFLSSRHDFARWADGRKQLRMEFFYRDMRRRTGLLMDGDQPVGGQWNFDAQNRRKMPLSQTPPAPPSFEADATTKAVLRLVQDSFHEHFGNLDGFDFPVTREQALASLTDFIDHRLPNFGDFQDSMRKPRGEASDDSLYHSLLGTSMNLGLIGPMEVCEAAEKAFVEGKAPLNAVEGFVRQIIGWREFVRGIYWLTMPGYAERNTFSASRPLPDFFWTAETDMACVRHAVKQTQERAYAHHIQRLMVTGNLALIAGLDPVGVNRWYLSVYADAFEWVQLPNTHGMVLYADGGFLGSKPYAASGKYIDRMSDYCKDCRYNVKDSTGPDACPLNALYWHFLMENEDRLTGNPRMGLVYRSLAKFTPQRRADLRRKATETLVEWGIAEDGVRVAKTGEFAAAENPSIAQPYDGKTTTIEVE